jgi:hypothetical protein
MASVERLRMLVQSAIDDWDIHIESCPECLIEGMHLCDDGAKLMDRFKETRARMHVAEQKEAARMAMGRATEPELVPLAP